MSGGKRVVFICSGNICRSPIAEAMLSARIEKQGLDLEASSAGTLGIEDHAADPDAIKAVGEEGIDLRNHRSRGVSRDIIEDAFAVIVMGPEHEEGLGARYPDTRDSIVRLWEYCPAGREAGEIEDPLGRGLNEFRRIRDVIRDALDHWLPSIGSS